MSMSDFRPIKGSAQAFRNDSEPGVFTLSERDEGKIQNLLMGKRVTKVDGEHLLLDDGTVIKAIGHDGGCSCSAGCYDLAVLNGVDNVITRVEFDYNPGDDGGHPYEGYYRIFVYADNQQINLMQFNGSDGNGYYGTGFEILVRLPEHE